MDEMLQKHYTQRCDQAVNLLISILQLPSFYHVSGHVFYDNFTLMLQSMDLLHLDTIIRQRPAKPLFQ